MQPHFGVEQGSHRGILFVFFWPKIIVTNNENNK